MEKVGVVTVAYNNTKELKRLIISINKQTYPIDKMFLIDNSCLEIARENKKVINEADFCVYYFHNKGNTGSAGGFSLGMRLSLKDNLMFTWLLDQDGYVSRKSLENLLEYKNYGDILAPRVLDNENHYELTTFRKKRTILGGFTDVLAKKDITYIDSAGTHGILIHNDVLEKLGFYDNKHYFVGFEDYDFCMRANIFGKKIALVKSSIVFHPDLTKKNNRKFKNQKSIEVKIHNFFKLYFLLRPSFLYKNDRRKFSIVFSRGFFAGKYLNEIQLIITLMYWLVSGLVNKIAERKRMNLLDTIKQWFLGVKKGRENRFKKTK